MSEPQVNITIKHRNKAKFLDIALCRSVYQLAEDVSKLYDIEAYRTSYLFNGKKLDRCKTLVESGIVAGSTIYLFIDKKRPVYIYIYIVLIRYSIHTLYIIYIIVMFSYLII